MYQDANNMKMHFPFSKITQMRENPTNVGGSFGNREIHEVPAIAIAMFTGR